MFTAVTSWHCSNANISFDFCLHLFVCTVKKDVKSSAVWDSKNIIFEKWYTFPRPARQKKVSYKIPEHIDYRIWYDELPMFDYE